jgi:hypothetical protein
MPINARSNLKPEIASGENSALLEGWSYVKTAAR